MKLSSLTASVSASDDKKCRIQRWAMAWSESFRHEAGQQFTADSRETIHINSQTASAETAAAQLLVESQG